ncbi:MAG TPA: GGDEF domain-containing protein, partial [Piscirickettsiaceae bacterium]|nr:GGDEF domain-containing protein [Piscirickettsiaceae bacterium]
MSTANSIPVDKRRTSPAVARCRKAEKYRKTLWRHRLQGWLRQLPRWLMHKTSLSALVEAQVKARTEQLFRQANYDALTHLPNRAFFMQTMENTFKQAEHTQTPFALLFLDLDGFKPVNDTFGHSAGDELLRMVAARLIASIRDDDFVARLGGDEFVILLRNVVDREIIETISKRLIQEISRPYWVDGRTVHISTSVGISEHPHDGKTAAQLIENA